jgi:putative nucleotidyltransferase with HDIG domain
MAKQQRRAFQSTIAALVYSLTLKDPAAARHSERVQAIALELGRRLSLTSSDMEILSVAALLHDLGKQGVRDELLFKPEKLSEAETNEMAQHAAYTQSILDMIEFPEELREVPRIAAYHHEKLDGTGPFGVAGTDIPIQALIISVADVFDALVTPRPYKNALSPAEAIAIVRHGKGSHWDDRVVGAMEAALPTVLHEVYAIKDAPEIPPASQEDEEPPIAKAA